MELQCLNESTKYSIPIYYIMVRPNKKMLMKCNNFEEKIESQTSNHKY
jgi:hypothetical protein